MRPGKNRLNQFPLAALVLALVYLCARVPAQDITVAEEGWPCWLGPYGTCRAIPHGQNLITSISKAKLLWVSADKTPDGRNCGNSDGASCLEISGGFSSPVVHKNRVYLFYYVPSGTVYDTSRVALSREADRWLIDADDVVHCFDAATGATLWKKVFKGKGLNFCSGGGKTGPLLTPCIAGDRVYAMGTMGRVYCLDAATGDSLWEGDIGPRFEMMKALKTKSLAILRAPSFNRDLMSCPMVIEGTVVCNTHTLAKGDFSTGYLDSPSGIIALDAATGQKLWRKDTCAGYMATPARWVNEGKEYVIIGNDGYQPSQKVWCIEPKTGKVLWSTPTGPNRNGVYVSGDKMLCVGGSLADPKVALYKLELTKATQLWTLGLPGTLGNCPPVWMGDHAYIRLSGGQFLCVELATGKMVGNFHSLIGNMAFSAGSDNIILVDNDQGHIGGLIDLFYADPANFKKASGPWGVPAAYGYELPIMPAIVDGRVYIRMRNNVSCYDFRAASTSVRSPAPRGSGPGVRSMGGRILVDGLDAGDRVLLLNAQGRVMESVAATGARATIGRGAEGVAFVKVVSGSRTVQWMTGVTRTR